MQIGRDATAYRKHDSLQQMLLLCESMKELKVAMPSRPVLLTLALPTLSTKYSLKNAWLLEQFHNEPHSSIHR